MTIDFSKLQRGDFVPTLDAEAVLQNYITRLQQLNPTRYQNIAVGDPVYNALASAAYAETIYRQSVNDAAANATVAFAAWPMLDIIVNNLGEQRLGNESDDELRQRAVLALEKISTAGPRGAYHALAMGANSDVKDVSVQSPAPAQITVTVQSKSGNGEPSAAVLADVAAALNDDAARPLADYVTVQAASIVTYDLSVTLTLFAGQNATDIQARAQADLATFVAQRSFMGTDVPHAGIYAAAQQDGVDNVIINSPVSSLILSATQAPYCTGITVNIA